MTEKCPATKSLPTLEITKQDSLGARSNEYKGGHGISLMLL
jgi:hypothetical protein